jgi:hypothetical protein
MIWNYVLEEPKEQEKGLRKVSFFVITNCYVYLIIVVVHLGESGVFIVKYLSLCRKNFLSLKSGIKYI